MNNILDDPRGAIKHARSYILVLLSPGPKYEEVGPQKNQIQSESLNYFAAKHKEEIIALGGHILDDPKLKALLILNVESKEEAQRVLSADPGIKSGQFRYELFDLFTSGAFVLPEKPVKV